MRYGILVIIVAILIQVIILLYSRQTLSRMTEVLDEFKNIENNLKGDNNNE